MQKRPARCRFWVLNHGRHIRIDAPMASMILTRGWSGDKRLPTIPSNCGPLPKRRSTGGTGCPNRFSPLRLLRCCVVAARTTPADTFAYIGNADSNDISVFHVEPSNGAVKAVETVPFPGVEKPGSSTPLAVSPDHQLLFAGVWSEPYTVLNLRDRCGKPAVSPLAAAARSPTAWPISRADRTGKFLFSASYGGNKVAINPIGADDTFGEPTQVIPTGLNAHAFPAVTGQSFCIRRQSRVGPDPELPLRRCRRALTPEPPPRSRWRRRLGRATSCFIRTASSSISTFAVRMKHEVPGPVLLGDLDRRRIVRRQRARRGIEAEAQDLVRSEIGREHEMIVR